MVEPWNAVHVFEVESDGDCERGIDVESSGAEECPAEPEGGSPAAGAAASPAPEAAASEAQPGEAAEAETECDEESNSAAGSEDMPAEPARAGQEESATHLDPAEEQCAADLQDPSLNETSEDRARRLREARALAERLRAEEPLLQSAPRSSRDNPDFVRTFFRASRLHFIGVWRERYEEILDSLPPAPPLPQPPRGQQRLLLHVDMDCFFASAACLGREALLRGLPLAVAWGAGGSSEISSANYEARAKGVRAGMWVREALPLCPDLVVMPYEFERIVGAAEKMYRTLLQMTPHLQGVSCDEAYADVTHLCGAAGAPQAEAAAEALALQLRREVRASSGCGASVGVAANRLLARLGTREAKPRVDCSGCRTSSCSRHPGVFLLRSTEAAKHLAHLPVQDLPGVGPRTRGRLAELGVETAGQLLEVPEPRLRSTFGEAQARQLRSLAAGVDERPWEPRPPHRSVGAQIAWGVRFDTPEQANDFCRQLAEEAAARLGRRGARGRTLTVKVWRAQKGTDMPRLGCGACDVVSRSARCDVDPAKASVVCAEALRLYGSVGACPAEVRGVGVHIGELEPLKPGGKTSVSIALASGAKPGLQLQTHPEMGKALESGKQVVLHVDCNCFFLAVHVRHDPTLQQAGPLVLWQYNDVICVSPEAKAAGVRKHMRPTEALPLVEGIGGRMVHAFSRKWPGPRVWYGPYNQASREVFAWLRACLDRELGGRYVLERVSVDEAYVDVSAAVGGSLSTATALARRLMPEMAEATGIRTSIGVAPNRLLAKLASVAAKPPRDGVYAVAASAGAREEAMSGTIEDLLQMTAAAKLPGLGSRAAQLEALGLRTAADLWTLTVSDLQAQLGLSGEAAARLAELCHGRDATPVQPGDPKKSLAATSWLTDACLGDVALKSHAGRGGEAVTIGSGWVFEPHADRSVSNSTRVRWILLALVLDLDERIVEEFLEFHQIPTKLTISYQGPGTRKEPGVSGFTDGHSHSRTAPFPTAAYRGLQPEDGRVAVQVPQPPAEAAAPAAPAAPVPALRVHTHSVYGTEFLAPATSPGAPGLADGPEVLGEPRRRTRVAALVDACAAQLVAWARELKGPAPVAQLTLTARGMEAVPALGPSAIGARRFEGSAQRTLEETFARATKRPRLEPAPLAAAAEGAGAIPAVNERGPAGKGRQVESIWEIPSIEVSDEE